MFELAITVHEKSPRLVAAVLLAASLAGCAGSGGTTKDRVGRLLVAPDKYVLYTCPAIATAMAGTAARQKQLEDLMAKAGDRADGRVVSALAYQPEYVQLQGDMNELRATAHEKDCKPVLAAKPAPPAVKPKAAKDDKPR
jgi:hypothetical protein